MCRPKYTDLTTKLTASATERGHKTIKIMNIYLALAIIPYALLLQPFKKLAEESRKPKTAMSIVVVGTVLTIFQLAFLIVGIITS